MSQLVGQVLASKYLVKKKIGGGSFGEIYLGQDMKTRLDVAIKLENQVCKIPQVCYEAYILKKMKNVGKPFYMGKLTVILEGFPELHAVGKEGDFNFIVLDLLGPSLEDLFNVCGRKFSLKTTILLVTATNCGISYLSFRFEALHKRQFIHRDIKPDNFLMGLRNKSENTVNFIDFGLCKKYKDQIKGTHIPYRRDKALTGTARFASIHSHLGEELSRRDDLESLSYMMLYFYLGELPWQNIENLTRYDKFQKIKEMKMSTGTKVLCKDCPKQFLQFLEYCKHLQFTEEPNYQLLRDLLLDLATREGVNIEEANYDWDAKEFKMLCDYQNRQLFMTLKTGFAQVLSAKRKEQDESKKQQTQKVGVNYMPLNHEKQQHLAKQFQLKEEANIINRRKSHHLKHRNDAPYWGSNVLLVRQRSQQPRHKSYLHPDQSPSGEELMLIDDLVFEHEGLAPKTRMRVHRRSVKQSSFRKRRMHREEDISLEKSSSALELIQKFRLNNNKSNSPKRNKHKSQKVKKTELHFKVNKLGGQQEEKLHERQKQACAENIFENEEEMANIDEGIRDLQIVEGPLEDQGQVKNILKQFNPNPSKLLVQRNKDRMNASRQCCKMNKSHYQIIRKSTSKGEKLYKVERSIGSSKDLNVSQNSQSSSQDTCKLPLNFQMLLNDRDSESPDNTSPLYRFKNRSSTQSLDTFLHIKQIKSVSPQDQPTNPYQAVKGSFSFEETPRKIKAVGDEAVPEMKSNDLSKNCATF